MTNLLFLKYFCDAAANRSIAQAAKSNRISSSAISVAIKKLEEYFEKDLLVHKRNRFELTPDGKYLFLKARSLLQSAKRLEEDVLGRTMDFKGTIEFGIQDIVAQALYPKIAKTFRSRYPDIALKPQFAKKTQLKRWIDEDEFEFCIAMTDVDSNPYENLELLSGEYRCLNFSGKKDPTKANFVLVEDGIELSDFQRSFLKFFNTEAMIELFVPSWELVHDYAKLNSIIGLVPDFVSTTKTKVDFPSLKYSLGAFFKKGSLLTSKSQLFLEQAIQGLKISR